MEKSKQFVKIDKDELRSLLDAANRYWALEHGGVDNWTWYGDSIHEYVASCKSDLGIEDDDFYMDDIVEHDLAQYEDDEIVTCENCTFSESAYTPEMAKLFVQCGNNYVRRDHFCSKGERK